MTLTPIQQNRLLDRTGQLLIALQDIAKAWDEYETSGDSEEAAIRLFSTLDKVRSWMKENEIG